MNQFLVMVAELGLPIVGTIGLGAFIAVSYTHLRAHET